MIEAARTREASELPRGLGRQKKLSNFSRTVRPINPTGNDHYLFTPGPLTTSIDTKRAVLRDWGSRDQRFIELNTRVRHRLLDVVNGHLNFTCVPIQGSGTFAVEAIIGTMLPRTDAKLLVLVNGAYGKRIAHMARSMGRPVITVESPEDKQVDLKRYEDVLRTDPSVTHVAVVHHETTSGVLNPLTDIATITEQYGKRLLIDAMSSFGAVHIDVGQMPAVDAVVSSANKCLEGLPGVAFALLRQSRLEKQSGVAHSLALDLYDQWAHMKRTQQWRFTPPTHIIAALDAAIDQFLLEGGVSARGGRYYDNCQYLLSGMTRLGFESLLDPAIQGPIIATFHIPKDPKFNFDKFYSTLSDQGFVIYPGKLTVANTFRIGCIGQIGKEQIRDLLLAIKAYLTVNNIKLPKAFPDTEEIEPVQLTRLTVVSKVPFSGDISQERPVPPTPKRPRIPVPNMQLLKHMHSVIFDWAGTIIDYGSSAPAGVFVKVFELRGVPITLEEARVPMGKEKRAHIQQICEMVAVQDRWKLAHGRLPTTEDIDAMYKDFIPLQVDALPAYSKLIPGTMDVFKKLRASGTLIGTTTGYNHEMNEVNLREAAKQGFVPDCSVSASDVPMGRPSPAMALLNAIKLSAPDMSLCVKVDDTIPGIAEGLNAGMWTIGVSMTGNENGGISSPEEMAKLNPIRRSEIRRNAGVMMFGAGAHYVIDGVHELPACLDEIEKRMAVGDTPRHM